MQAIEFLKQLPDTVNPQVIEGMSTIFHFDLQGDDGGQITVALDNGKIDVSEGLIGEPKCVVTSSTDNFVKLVKGELNPMMAIMMGKVKITNQGEMLKFAKILGMMK